MAETNRDAEMQIGGRNGANMPFVQKNRKNEPLVGSCFTQCSAFWKDTLKTEARFAIDSVLGVLKEKLAKNGETVDQNANRGLYALWRETP